MVRKPHVPTECLAVDGGDLSDLSDDCGQPKKPGQFVVLDDHTKLTLPGPLAVVVPAIFQFEARPEPCHRQGPLALDWMKTNDAGGGAYNLGVSRDTDAVSIHDELARSPYSAPTAYGAAGYSAIDHQFGAGHVAGRIRGQE